MLSKVIQYNDLEGNQVQGEFWFHLSIAEILEMENEVEGGLRVRMQRMTEGMEQTKVLSTMRGIVTRAVGVKSSDGRRFLKSPEDKSYFLDSDAYSKFLIELLTVPKAAVDFFNGVVPKDLKEQAEAAGLGSKEAEVHQALQEFTASATATPTSTVTPVSDSPLNAAAFGHAEEPDWTDWRSYTEKQLLEMDNDMFEALGGKVRPGIDKVLMGIAFKRRARSTQGGA